MQAVDEPRASLDADMEICAVETLRRHEVEVGHGPEMCEQDAALDGH